MLKCKRALISVSNKKGLIPFARGLHAFGVEILSTGGTARQLKEAGIPVQEVGDYTGFPEMLDGRVKTLHPKIHGGLLALRENPEHMEQLKAHGIPLIDMVVVNLYPFESVIQKKHVSLEEAIENIDIGGPTMLRSAAKNYKSVATICNPDHYQSLLKDLKNNNGLLPDSVLYQLAVEVFEHTARYDTIVSQFLAQRLGGDDFNKMPQDVHLRFTKMQDLRYGENPHQQAAFYQQEKVARGLAGMKQLHGKELSFNNFLDLHAAVDIIKDFNDPAAVVIKHNNPTGVAQDATLALAYKKAHACDPISAFGGIIGLNQKVDAQTAALIHKSGFMECVVAPGFDADALPVLKQKKNLRLLTINFKTLPKDVFDFKKVAGGLLLQEKDTRFLSESDMKVVTQKKPTQAQVAAFFFGWKVVKHVRSNAVILVKGNRTLGLGCGQTSRVESLRIAIEKAGKQVRGSVMVSDAFLPKVDNIELAAAAGIKAIIQTGGSISDVDVIAAADAAGIAMVTTGVRHFKH